MVTDGRPALSRDTRARATPWRFAVVVSVTIHGAAAAGLLFAATMARPEAGIVADGMVVELVIAESIGSATEPSASGADLPAPMSAAPLPTEAPSSAPSALQPAAIETWSANTPPAPRARPAQPAERSARRPAHKARDRSATSGDVGPTTRGDSVSATPAAIAAGHVSAAGIPVVTRARYRETPTPPVYPRRARDLSVTGTTILRALVDRDGRTKEVRVWRSSGSEVLDEAAAAAARRWAFAPAQIEDRTVEAWVEIPVKFELM